uniref:Toxin Tpa6 n=1 Tax=Tityus pachyurus TaxID=288781 RepID=SCX6_TITPA|nr:RecName: Full=Toxin Tpa6; AltName: Full=T-alpha* NaTx7.4; Flags: Precursor [Tityus pachyurus]CCD31435.1 scorpion toxin Tpa6 precursor [Tityus pachyurus]
MSIFPIALALLLIGLEEGEAARDGYPLSKNNNCKIYCPDTDVCKDTCKNRASAPDGKCDGWNSCYCFKVPDHIPVWGDPGTKPCMT